MPIAHYIWIRRSSLCIFTHHIIHHLLFILFSKIPGLKRDPQMCRHPCRVQTILARYAWNIRIKPHFHMNPSHIETALFKKRCGDGRIHATGQGDKYFLCGLTFHIFRSILYFSYIYKEKSMNIQNTDEARKRLVTYGILGQILQEEFEMNEKFALYALGHMVE